MASATPLKRTLEQSEPPTEQIASNNDPELQRPAKRVKMDDARELIPTQPQPQPQIMRSNDPTIPSKGRRHLIRGYLQRLVCGDERGVPNEIVEEVCCYLTSKDILSLCRANAWLFRQFRKSETRWGRVWRNARANLCNAPPPPPGMSEANYASFIAEKQCMVCPNKASFIDTGVGVRCCHAHMDNLLVAVSKMNFDQYFPDGEEHGWQSYIFFGRFFPTHHHNGKSYVNRASVLGFVADMRNAESREEFDAVCGRLLQLKAACQEHSTALVECNKRRQAQRIAWQTPVVEERQKEICKRLRARKDWTHYDERDLAIDPSLPNNNRWEVIMRDPRQVTDKHWKNIQPYLVAILAERKKARRDKTKQVAKMNRNEIVENILQEILDDQTNAFKDMHAPASQMTHHYDISRRQATSEEIESAIKKHLFSVLPAVDVMKVAKEYIRGKEPRTSSREKVAKHTKNDAWIHILRTRAALAKMLQHVDAGNDNASKEMVDSFASSLKHLDNAKDYTNATEIASLQANDAEVRALVYHPAAFFEPWNQRTPTRMALWRTTLVGQQTPKLKFNREYMDMSQDGAPLAHHYPTVFHTCATGPNESPLARHLRVMIPQRRMAQRILEETNFSEEDVMSCIAMTKRVFKCDRCPAHGYMTWSQLVNHYLDEINAARAQQEDYAHANPDAIPIESVHEREVKARIEYVVYP